ncbi:Indoleamine 2,3-dioxygenase [Aspergillus avenaceus]|uniref:Indoleamine 2,3-dioxygenase n=1 Tax=Aspergillus avenaceus TaxID=36643 RepID=A0A5N6TZY2_ASPAV|nr:Indoleamine 2,3-dioxygenase [Aspergillus avenaceus]
MDSRINDPPHSHDSIKRHGFLPPELPLQALSCSYYEPWEAIAIQLPHLISHGTLRTTIEDMPVLHTHQLCSELEWRRAYVLLIFMLHGYVWGGGGSSPKEVIPPPVSIPLLDVAAHRELPPPATFAGLCLWNYRVWFYLISVAIEAYGARLVSLLLEMLSASQKQDRDTVARCLQASTGELRSVNALLRRMRDRCQPHIFYHQIRPFLNGSKNAAEAGLPQGIIYDDGTGSQGYRCYYGGSNAQSSLIQLLDIALGAEHTSSAGSYLVKMRSYMPGEHRRFLERVALGGNVRDFVRAHSSDEVLTGAYNSATKLLRELRDIHLWIVSQYIITQHSKTLKPMEGSSLNQRTEQSFHREEHKGEAKDRSGTCRGTGGMPLVRFLRRVRDDTKGV